MNTRPIPIVSGGNKGASEVLTAAACADAAETSERSLCGMGSNAAVIAGAPKGAQFEILGVLTKSKTGAAEDLADRARRRDVAADEPK